MDFSHHIDVAIGNLLSSKLRTILAMLGILVGTASVVALVSSGQLATQQALLQFKTLGTDLLSVAIYDHHSETTTVSNKPLELETAVNIRKVSPKILQIAPYTTLFANLSFQGKKLNGSIIGSTDALQDIIKIKIAKGRFISFLDQHAEFCIIGHHLYQQIQRNNLGPVIGKQIRVGDNYFTIVGIAEQWPENAFFYQDINDSVIIPAQTSYIINPRAQINNIIMRIAEGTNIDKLEEKLEAYLLKETPNKKPFMRSAEELIKSMTNQRQIFTLLLGLIGSIALLVGGIGVMNIMLVSVVERRREIGIRRAIGAKRRDIQMMFLFESIGLSVIGGILGVLLGVSSTYIIASIAHWQFTLMLLPPLIGFSVSVMIGVFFGFYPAYQASRLDPIETLRSE